MSCRTISDVEVDTIQHHSQFTEVPPLNDIQELFMKASGLKLSLYTTWLVWKPLDPEDYFVFQPYIRPCHQRILMETINGQQPNPCSFLRQLLRPYGLLIQKSNSQYKIVEHTNPTVGKKAGLTIVWSSLGEPT